MPGQLSVDPDRQVKATDAVLVRMTEQQKAAIAAYAQRHRLSYGAACRQLLDKVLNGKAAT